MLIGIGNATYFLRSPQLENAICTSTITTPIDNTQTVPSFLTYCSTGAIVIDTVAAGSGIVDINGAWRLT